MKRALSFIAIALFATTLQSQQSTRGSVTGVVKDAATGLPLDRVSVTIMGTAFGATTAADGRYTIAELPAGIHTLRATRVGYTPATVADMRVSAGQATIRDISLPVQSLQLASIETIRGQAAAALYGQRSGTAAPRCDDPLTPRDADCVLISRAEREALALRNEAPYSQFLFAPELVMRHQNQIGLQDAQRTRIIGEMSQAQAKFTEIQWALSGEEEKLNRLLQGTSPAETAVIAQMDRILAMEETIKRTQMQLLVRIKNVLTPEQQAALSRLREQ